MQLLWQKLQRSRANFASVAEHTSRNYFSIDEMFARYQLPANAENLIAAWFDAGKTSEVRPY